MTKRLTLLWIAAWTLMATTPVLADHHEDVTAAGGPESVARALFTLEVTEREPGEPVTRITSDTGEVLFYTELVGLKGHTVWHRWEWNGQLMAEVSFEVRGPRWRVWSSKTLLPDWTGDWKVTVVDGGQSVLAERSLRVSMLPATPAQATDPAPEEAVAPSGQD